MGTFRYIFQAARVSMGVAGERDLSGIWFGLESDEPIDLEAYSRETDRDLIPCSMTAEELDSVFILNWIRE